MSIISVYRLATKQEMLPIWNIRIHRETQFICSNLVKLKISTMLFRKVKMV